MGSEVNDAGGAKTLIVDDDPIASLFLQEALAELGHQTVVVNSAEAGWEALQRDSDIRLACIDWILPGISGPELCARIKAEIDDRYVYTILVTTKTSKQDLIAGIDAGADDFLSKPLHVGELVCRIHSGERVLQYDRSLRAESAQAERLLNAILPRPIAERMKNGEMRISDYIDECTVMFVDICGFTDWCMNLNPGELVGVLDELFSLYDDHIRTFGAEKIKSIGDAYMIAAGIPEPNADHAQRIAELARSLSAEAAKLSNRAGEPLMIRTGIASGVAIAGVIGKERFIYDVWGPTVNLASRLEGLAPPGCILIDETHRRLLNGDFETREFGTVRPKGFDAQTVWVLQ